MSILYISATKCALVNDLVSFLRENWQFISTAIIGILTIILAIVKKKPITEIIDNSAYKDLILLVNEAESKFGAGNGSKKLDYVLSAFCSVKGITKDSWNYVSIKNLVENILSTPERKESHGQKK